MNPLKYDFQNVRFCCKHERPLAQREQLIWRCPVSLRFCEGNVSTLWWPYFSFNPLSAMFQCVFQVWIHSKSCTHSKMHNLSSRTKPWCLRSNNKIKKRSNTHPHLWFLPSKAWDCKPGWCIIRSHCPVHDSIRDHTALCMCSVRYHVLYIHCTVRRWGDVHKPWLSEQAPVPMLMYPR